MHKHPKRSRAAMKRSRWEYRPAILGLEPRALMASGLAAASAQAERSAEQVATSILLGEVTSFLARQPLPAPFVARLNRGIEQGSLSRDKVFRRILRTPQVQAGLVRGLAEDLLHREPTPAETRALVGGMQDGADVPWAVFQIMAKPEYFRGQGATNTGFVQAATMELLNRPATSEELAGIVPGLDRGGGPARAQFLRALIGGSEFRPASTQDAYLQFAGTSGTPEEHASALQAFQGPLGYTKMLAHALGSAANSTGLVPTLAQNPGLSVKRVPGFLPGWKVPNLAAPYDVANIPDRTIDQQTVDYWAITLDQFDAVTLNIVPTDRPGDAGFAVRIWGPDGKEIGTAGTGVQFTFVAATAGTYTLGISTKGNTGYSFQPMGKQPTPSGPTLRTYTAEFQTYPGTNTNPIDILLDYKNPAYTDGNWPAWTAAQSTAYATLTKIASANSQVPGNLQNFTDFRQVGNQVDPQAFIRWLTATWAPFQNMLDDPNNPDIIADTYHAFPVIQQAYGSVASFADQVANAFLSDQATQAAFVSVNELLQGANDARSNLYNDYLLKFQSWSTSNEVFLGQDPTNIATLMSSGLTAAPQLPKPVDPKSWIERLLSSIVTFAAGVASAISGSLIPGSGPVAGLGVSTAGNLIVNTIDAWLDGDFGKPPPPPPPTRRDIFGAADDMENAALTSYKNTFDLLMNQSFLSSMFSNYGLLQAMGTAEFTYSPGDNITPAEVLKQHYDRSVWEQLLPQLFSWRIVAPTDDGPADTLPNFTFFVPYNERAQWESPDNVAPLNDGTSWSWDYYPENGKYPFTPPGGNQRAIADARAQVAALQAGKSGYPFGGYDFTPTNWFGPGPLSVSQEIDGRLGRFYTVSTDAHLSQTLYRHGLYGYFGWNGSFQNWYSWADFDGIAIHQWALETPDGQGGYLELSQDAAEALFGTGPLVTASPNPVAYKGGGSYFDFKVPADGLATRFEVFTQWGKGIPGYAPSSLRPAPTTDGGNMHVGLNSGNYYTQFFDNSYATTYSLTYGANRARSMRKPGEVPSGPGPGPRLSRRS